MKKTNELEIVDKRNYGIDLLRIVAMFFVVLLHSVGQGGILLTVKENTLGYKTFWFMEIVALVAVDIFSIISGYVSYSPKEKNVKYSNYINIWLEVVFYGILVTLIFNIFTNIPIKTDDYIITMLPVTNDLYWYFTAFTGLYIIKPFLDKGLRACSEATIKKIFVALIVCFSLFATISNAFYLKGGYSFIWIVIMYILGVCIRKCEIGKNTKISKLIILTIVLYIITYLYKIYGFEFKFLNININKDLLVSYTSPTILISSICYVLIFTKLKITGGFRSIVKFVTPTYFSIYILNNHRLIWEYLIKDMFLPLINQRTLVITSYILGFSLLFAVVSILIDRFRIKIFDVLKMKSLSKKIEKLLYKFINKLSKAV